MRLCHTRGGALHFGVGFGFHSRSGEGAISDAILQIVDVYLQTLYRMTDLIQLPGVPICDHERPSQAALGVPVVLQQSLASVHVYRLLAC